MATRFRPLVAFLICALLLGCGTHPSSVREAMMSQRIGNIGYAKRLSCGCLRYEEV